MGKEQNWFFPWEIKNVGLEKGDTLQKRSGLSPLRRSEILLGFFFPLTYDD